MARFQTLVVYPTDVQLPDSTVIHVEPGDVAELAFDDPGPLWKKTTSKATVETPPPAAQPAPTETADTASEPALEPEPAPPAA